MREAAGDRFDELELNIYPSMTGISVTDHARREAEELAEALHARSGVRVSADELLESPHIFIGSVDGFVEKFTRLREELGISSIMVGEVDELGPWSSAWPGPSVPGRIGWLESRDPFGATS